MAKKWVQKAKRILGAVAPMLATGLGGPLAGAATSILSKELLGKEGAGEDELEEAILSGTPDVLLKLKTAEQTFKVQMEELGIKKEKLVYDDKDSARQREMVVRDKMPGILAIGAVAGFISYVVAITFAPPAAMESELLFFILGQLSGHAGTAFAYYHGSSRGSSEKTEALKDAINKN